MQLIIASHEKLASAILATAEMFTGKAENVQVLQFFPGDSPEDFEDDLRGLIAKRQAQEQTLILCDLFAGTPFNVSSKVSYQDDSICVMYGMNVAMVVEAILSRQGHTARSLAESIVTQLPESFGIGQF